MQLIRQTWVNSYTSCVSLSKLPILSELSLWKGNVADAIATPPTSPKSSLSLPAAVALCSLTASHLRYQHLEASLLELFPAPWEFVQPVCRAVEKCQGFTSSGTILY